MALEYGESYVNYGNNGEVVYRSPILANLRGAEQAFVPLANEDYGVFTEDIEYVSDAIFYGSNEPKQFERDYYGDWVQTELKLEVNQYTYYHMILVDHCWCYLGIYLDALDRLDEMYERDNIRERLLGFSMEVA